MASAPKRTGSLFSLGAVSPEDLPRFLRRLRHHAPSRLSYERQREILEAWFGLCTESADGIVDREMLCEQVDITRSGLIHHLKALERIEIVSRSERRPDARRRRVVCYELREPAGGARPDAGTPDLFDNPLVEIGDAQVSRLEERDALEALFRRPDSITCAPIEPGKRTFKGERLTVLTLAPTLNVGRRGATEKTTRLWRGTRSFVVTVRAISGHRIPNVQDLRPFVVAWTLARDQLRHMDGGVPAHPVFVMSLRAICKEMGFTRPSANNLRQTFNRLRRFRSSEWQLTDDRYNVLRNFRTNGLLERDKYMSFISDLEVMSTVGAHGKTPDVVAITFHPALTPALSDSTRSLTLHKEFIQGKHREFDQLVYQWCRQTVQHNHVPAEYALERVHREAHPSATFAQFCQGLERMARDGRYERPENVDRPVVLIPGYLLGFDLARNTLAASARTNDPHLGTSSKYALVRGTAGRADRPDGRRSTSEQPVDSTRTLSEVVGDMRPGESGRDHAMRMLAELKCKRGRGRP